jgi:predicted O-methyltransferase YrrM
LPEPPLVTRARELGFERPELGQLLHVLAAQRGRQRVGSIGGGCGVAAWLVSALPPEVPFVTVELDETVAGAVMGLFADDDHVTVLQGDWHELLPAEAPFDLLFYDGGDGDAAEVVGLLAPGGTLVIGNPPSDRDFWFEHPALTAIELLVAPETAAIVAVRG